MKRNKWFIIIAITMLVLSNVCCDDGGGNDIPDTGVADADELIENTADAADDVDDIFDMMRDINCVVITDANAGMCAAQ